MRLKEIIIFSKFLLVPKDCKMNLRSNKFENSVIGSKLHPASKEIFNGTGRDRLAPEVHRIEVHYTFTLNLSYIHVTITLKILRQYL